MAVQVEDVAEDVLVYMQARFPTQLAAVATAVAAKGYPNYPLPYPRKESYLIGEPSRYRVYQAPAVLVSPMRADRTKDPTRDAEAVTDFQVISMLVILLIEGRDENELSRVCMRYARAASESVHNADVGTTAAYTATVYVNGIDYGVTFTRDQSGQRVFRKDATLELRIHFRGILTMG